MDLNDFKRVNDHGGHAAGDQLLAELALERTIRLRPRDVVGRLGGDEFVFLLPDTDEAAARRLVQRLQAASMASWCLGIAGRRVGEDSTTVWNAPTTGCTKSPPRAGQRV